MSANAGTNREALSLATRVPGLLGDLRSDHAGETGAVMIYRGILAVASDRALRDFAARHMATERRHLDLMEALLPPDRRSLLLPIWRLAGFLTGCLPALAGPHAVYATIEAVESFVDRHYAEQLAKLPADAAAEPLRQLLQQCQAEEVEHRDEAAALRGAPPGPRLRGWAWMVGHGSAAAVAAARRL